MPKRKSTTDPFPPGMGGAVEELVFKITREGKHIEGSVKLAGNIIGKLNGVLIKRTRNMDDFHELCDMVSEEVRLELF